MISLVSILTNSTVRKILFVLLLVSVVLAYVSYNSAMIASLRKENILMEETIKKQSEEIHNIKSDITKINQTKDEYYKVVELIQLKQNDLDKVMHRELLKKDSLGEVAKKAAEKVQYRVNKATKNILNCFVKVTKEDEKDYTCAGVTVN